MRQLVLEFNHFPENELSKKMRPITVDADVYECKKESDP